MLDRSDRRGSNHLFINCKLESLGVQPKGTTIRQAFVQLDPSMDGSFLVCYVYNTVTGCVQKHGHHPLKNSEARTKCSAKPRSFHTEFPYSLAVAVVHVMSRTDGMSV